MNEVFISAEMSIEGPLYPGAPGAVSSSFSGGSGVSVTCSAPCRRLVYMLLARSIRDAAYGVQWASAGDVGSQSANMLFLLI
jgi:hypothetical protein